VRRRSLLVAAALLAAGCGGSGAPDVERADALDPAALTGTVSTVDGDDLDLAAFAGRDLVVWFWSPW
jgi:hypothetical protein